MTGLLRAPEEKKPVQILIQLKQKLAEIPQSEKTGVLTRLVNHPHLFQWHLSQLPDTEGEKQTFDRSRILAEWKLHHTDSIRQLESWLEPAEALALLRHPDCLNQLRRIGVNAVGRISFRNAGRNAFERTDLSAGAFEGRPGPNTHTGRLLWDTWDTYLQQIL